MLRLFLSGSILFFNLNAHAGLVDLGYQKILDVDRLNHLKELSVPEQLGQMKKEGLLVLKDLREKTVNRKNLFSQLDPFTSVHSSDEELLDTPLESGATGSYISNLSPKNSIQKPIIVFSPQADRRTVVHEYMHHLLDVERQKRKAADVFALQIQLKSKKESLMLLVKEYSKNVDAIFKLSIQLNETAINIFKYFEIEEILIERYLYSIHYEDKMRRKRKKYLNYNKKRMVDKIDIFIAFHQMTMDNLKNNKTALTQLADVQREIDKLKAFKQEVLDL